MGVTRRAVELLLPLAAHGLPAAAPGVVSPDGRALPGAVVGSGRPPPDRRRGGGPARGRAQPRPGSGRLHVPAFLAHGSTYNVEVARLTLADAGGSAGITATSVS